MNRRMERMTAVQVQSYLQRTDAIILPVGTTECHGTHAPLGTDLLIAQATASLAAEKADALVAPPFTYTWAGATVSLQGTISLPVETVMLVVRQLCLACVWQGFRRIAVVSAHAPDSSTLMLAIRRVYEECGVTPVSFNVWGNIHQSTDPAAKELTDGEAAMPGFAETSMVIAACEVLGIENAVDMNTPEPAAPEHPVGMKDIYANGASAELFYKTLGEHIPKPQSVDPSLARQYIESSARAVAATLEALKAYGPEAAARARSWQH